MGRENSRIVNENRNLERVGDVAGTFSNTGGYMGVNGINNLIQEKNYPSFIDNITRIMQQQNQLGPDEFGSYVIPPSDPTYSSGFDYARSIAGGIPMSQVIAPGVSYSPEQPMGYTQEQLNIPVGTTPVETPQGTPSPYGVFADDPRYFGTGIGGVTIFDDKDPKAIPHRDIITGKIIGGTPRNNLQDIGKLFDLDLLPDFSQFVTKEDISSFIPEVPTGRDFSIDRDELIRDIRAGIDIPKYEAPDLSQFVRQEDIPSLIPNIPTGREFSIEDIQQGLNLPDFSQFAMREDIPTIPTFQQPDLSVYDTRLAELEKGLLGLQQPTGSSFSISQPRPRGLF